MALPAAESQSFQSMNVSPYSPIAVRFAAPVKASELTSIQVMMNGWEGGPTQGERIEGSWLAGEEGELEYSFMPSRPLQPGSLVVLRVPGAESTYALYSFLVDDGCSFGSKEVMIPSIKRTDGGAHNIPLHLTLPVNKQRSPVMFWVHGGGWSGGTAEESEAPAGKYAPYLANHLGVAVVGVAYRCKGSSGTFSKALKDVMDAVDYVRCNAGQLGIDFSKVGLYAGSAGTPLAAIAAQRTAEASLFIGYNGIYDFVHNEDSRFGQGNQYGQMEPSAEFNSAIYQLRQSPPDTLLLHGTADQTIHCRQSSAFGRAVLEAGGRARVHLYEGEVHAFFNENKVMGIPTLYEAKQQIIQSWGLR